MNPLRHVARLALVLAPVWVMVCAPGAEAKGPLDELRWLAGTWQRVGPDSHAEETWSLPRGGTMLGMFRLMEGGKTKFVELQTIRVEGDDVVLRILHTSPELVPWKSEANGPMRYVALSVRPGEAVFGNMHDDVKQIIYSLSGPAGLKVRLVRVVQGKTQFTDFDFVRPRAAQVADESHPMDPRCRPRGADRRVATDCCTPVPW